MDPTLNTKALIRRARIEDRTTVGSGQTFLEAALVSLTDMNSTGGLQTTSVSVAGKSVTFAPGTSVEKATLAVMDALTIWETWSEEEIDALLARRAVNKAYATF